MFIDRCVRQKEKGVEGIHREGTMIKIMDHGILGCVSMEIWTRGSERGGMIRRMKDDYSGGEEDVII